MDDTNLDQRRVAVELIATLANLKNVMVDLIFKPAGVSSEVYRPLMARRDEATGRLLSKRQIAPLLIDALDKQRHGPEAIRRIVEIGARWTSFELAHDEYAARAAVQKAQAVLGVLEQAEQRQAIEREAARKEEMARLERDRADLMQKQSELLLQMYDDLSRSDDFQRRGYLLEDLLTRLFDLHDIHAYSGFKRNNGGEQIDGAFTLGSWYYLVECRWRKEPADIGDLDGLSGKVSRSSRQTMGLFLSIQGWSPKVPALLKQNQDKSILLMDGYALRMVLCGEVDLNDYLVALGAQLGLKGEPFLTVHEYRSSGVIS